MEEVRNNIGAELMKLKVLALEAISQKEEEIKRKRKMTYNEEDSSITARYFVLVGISVRSQRTVRSMELL